MTMDTNDHIAAEVRKTINILDNLPELEASYLFRAHLLERIAHEPAKAVNSATSGLKLALMAFLLIVNIGSALVLMLSNGNEQMFSKHDILESLTDEYSSPALSYYLENDSAEDTND
ncbi:MAG: hypothetical protein MI702_06100 [Chlorobiales bacterium]|nr:hypothetical protein [Chlorobiales bacterium]